MSFILKVRDRCKNRFNYCDEQSPSKSLNNNPNPNPYLTLSYIGAISIKLIKCIAALFRDILDTDIKIAHQTF